MEVSTYKVHYRRDLNLALPIVVSQAGHMMVGLADSIMVGRVGIVPLAAASLANSLFMIVMSLGLGISFSVTPLVAAEDGKGERQHLAPLLSNTLFLYLLISLLLFVLLYFASPFIDHLDQPKAVAAQAIGYFNILMLSLIPLMLFQASRQFAEGLSHTRQAMIITLAANVVNIGLNYLLIYGHCGFRAMGLNGAGWATFISRCLMALAMTAFLRLPYMVKRYQLRLRWNQLSMKRARRLLFLGVPMGMQLVFEVSAFTGAAIIIGWLGAAQLAAHQIVFSMSATTYMVAAGLAAAATVRVGNQAGIGHFEEMRKAAFSIFHLVLLFMGICGVLFITLRHWLPRFFIDSPEVIHLASMIMIVAALYQLSDGTQVVALGALRGMADVKIPTAITLFAYWVIGLPAGYFLGFTRKWGITGVWMGLFLGLTTAAVLLAWRFHLLSQAKIKNHQALTENIQNVTNSESARN